MLVLRRGDGQWTEVTHAGGDVLRVRVCNVRPGHPGRVELVFDDPARNFRIERPERTRIPARPDGTDDARA